jgi:hypothetical protein
MLENPGLSVSMVARQLEYSSPQAFSRHVRCVMKMSPVEFRRMHNGEAMLQLFYDQLIVPHLHVLHDFHPVVAQPGWIACNSDVIPRGAAEAARLRHPSRDL